MNKEIQISHTDEMITINKEIYEILLKQDLFLSCLISCGVDNSTVWGDAQAEFKTETGSYYKIL